MKRRTFVAGSGLALLGGAVGGFAAHKSLTAGKPESTATNSRIPNVPVVLHNGQKVRFYDDLIKNRCCTINFTYAQCSDICPPMTLNLRKVQDMMGARVGRDLFMYSITLQPLFDTPQVLKRYADAFGVKPGWSFITGKEEHIEEIRVAMGFYNPDPELDKIDSEHTGLLRFGNDNLQRWGGCAAMARPEWIVKSLETALSLPGTPIQQHA